MKIPTAQKVMVQTREQMTNTRLPIAQVTLVNSMVNIDTQNTEKGN